MKKVTSADMARKFSEFCDMALNEPIVVTKNGRDRLVLLSVDEYNCLRYLAIEAREDACRGGLDIAARREAMIGER